jgi:hypothetical protein
MRKSENSGWRFAPVRFLLLLLLLSGALSVADGGVAATQRALGEPEPEPPESEPERENEPEPEEEPLPENLPENPPLEKLAGAPMWRTHTTGWLAVFAATSPLCVAQLAYLCCKLPSYRRFSLGTINLSLVILLSVSRCVVLAVDPYNVEHPSAPFLPLVVYGLGFPATNGLVLTMTLAAKNLVWSVFHLERVNGGMLYRRQAAFVTILLVQFVFQFLVDIVVGVSRQALGADRALAAAIPSLVISCHLLFDAFGIVLGIFLMKQIATLQNHIQKVEIEAQGKVEGQGTTAPAAASPLTAFLLPLRFVAALHFVYVGCSFAFIFLYGGGQMGELEAFLGIKNSKTVVEFSLIVVHVLFAFRLARIKLRRRQRRLERSSTVSTLSRSDVGGPPSGGSSNTGGDRRYEQPPTQISDAVMGGSKVQQCGGVGGGGSGVGNSSNTLTSSSKYIFTNAAEGSPYMAAAPLAGDRDPIANGIIIGYDWCELYVNTCNRLPYLPYEDICEDIPDRGLVRAAVERHLRKRRAIGLEALRFTSPQILLFSGEFALCVNGTGALRTIFEEVVAGSCLGDYVQRRVAEFVNGGEAIRQVPGAGKQVGALSAPMRKQSSILAMEILEGTELT